MFRAQRKSQFNFSRLSDLSDVQRQGLLPAACDDPAAVRAIRKLGPRQAHVYTLGRGERLGFARRRRNLTAHVNHQPRRPPRVGPVRWRDGVGRGRGAAGNHARQHQHCACRHQERNDPRSHHACNAFPCACTNESRPNSRPAFSVVIRSISATVVWRASATIRTVSATYAGSLRRPR